MRNQAVNSNDGSEAESLLMIESDATVPTLLPMQTVFVHVTKLCNLSCGYCYFSAKQAMPAEMDANEFDLLWPEIIALRPAKVVLTGGEPLLREDIFTLLSHMRTADPEHHVKRCLNTNGHAVTQGVSDRLIGFVDEVRVSLDGLAGTNDQLRGKGNFQAAVHAIDCLQISGFEPKVLITVTSASISDLEELLCFLYAREIRRVSLNMLRPIGRAIGRWDLRANAREVMAIVERVNKRFAPDAHSTPEPLRNECANCGVGQFLNILPNGDVFPCHVLTRPEFRCGNVRESSLLDICVTHGLLNELSQLDFGSLASRDNRLSELGRKGVCMGNVYAKTDDVDVWREELPSL